MKVRNSRDRDFDIDEPVTWDFGPNKEIILHLPPYSVTLNYSEAEMTKLWCVALQLGDTKTGSLALISRVCPTAELAAAESVSQFYTENPGVRTPLSGMAVLELKREYLVEALRLIDEEEQKPPSVVPLPRIVGDVMQTTTEADLHPAERAALHQARADAFGQAAQDLLDKQGTFRMPMYECPNCGAAGPRPGPCSVCGTEKIHRHHQHQYYGDALGMNIKCIVCGEPAPPGPAASGSRHDGVCQAPALVVAKRLLEDDPA